MIPYELVELIVVLESNVICPSSVLLIPYPAFDNIFTFVKFKFALLFIIFESAVAFILILSMFKLLLLFISRELLIVEVVWAVFLIVKLPLFVTVSPVEILCPFKSTIIVSSSFTFILYAASKFLTALIT